MTRKIKSNDTFTTILNEIGKMGTNQQMSGEQTLTCYHFLYNKYEINYSFGMQPSSGL